jgi:UDP-glucose 4-epimerase
MSNGGRYFLVGGAGFIGSHFVDRLLSEPGTDLVTVYDNFTSGRAWLSSAATSRISRP